MTTYSKHAIIAAHKCCKDKDLFFDSRRPNEYEAASRDRRLAHHHHGNSDERWGSRFRDVGFSATPTRNKRATHRRVGIPTHAHSDVRRRTDSGTVPEKLIKPRDPPNALSTDIFRNLKNDPRKSFLFFFDWLINEAERV